MKPDNEEKERKPSLPERKPGGLFSRLFEKLNSSMKEKEGCCGGKEGKKGGGCC